MSTEVAKVTEIKKPDEPGAISLTKELIGMDGQPVQLVEEDENGRRTTRDMTVRLTIMLSLRQGSAIAEQQKQLSEPDKIRCFELGVKVANEESTGCTFKPEDIVLIKKLANLRFSAEPYCAFLKIFDPTAFDK